MISNSPVSDLVDGKPTPAFDVSRLRCSYGSICPGQHIANRSIFINAALLLWSFRVTQDPNSPIDDKGFVDGVIAHPKPFDACFTPRTADEAHLREVMAKYAEGL